MKKIFSFITLLVYLIVGFFYNSMISFAVQGDVMKYMENQSHEHGMMIMNDVDDCCGKVNNQKDDKCTHECCIKSDGVTVSGISSVTTESIKKYKINVSNIIDIYAISTNSFTNKNLIKKTSPPIAKRDIKNYSYKDLVKIVKSNT